MSFFGKLFNTDKEESSALTKEQKQIEKKLITFVGTGGTLDD